MKKSITTLLLALIVFAVSAIPKEKDVGQLREPTKKEIFKAINDSRDLKQVEHYQIKQGLNIACKIRAVWLNVTGKFKHNSHPILKYDGEVLTNDSYYPVQAWLKSPPHRSLLLSKNFNKIGIGKSGNIVVVRFRRC